ncbi:methylated-DNA--[protein]-cysteine S-methyltransferase [Streptomyces sp. NBC_01433]|uniref:methylated-DNA--[protein]-cysteine S-methyltransferase n=1 Tax=Streptomyces sp. NBC_01433 TaxID=2903864 RepID=UPI00225815B5|nr:methylated-DNA--[protein]-cysteine S-methyltransferase [Streptomyces sp. NBC_01433]MCX4674982.1 methylated-DNA--[protein]-cysteine S-methyltransferase [Streptomyces sp. NBC_01433]
MTTVYAKVGSPLGELLLVGEMPAGTAGTGGADAGTAADSPGTSDGVALVSLSLPGQKGGAVVQDGWRQAPELFSGIAAQLEAYFAGRLTRFDIPYADGVGTEFQRRVWQALDTIPYGETVSYGQIAALVGSSGAGVRAVGTAIGRNPLLVVRPCHRVIGADGALRGYAGGLESKERLLGLEGASVPRR